MKGKAGMIYQSDRMKLECSHFVKKSDVNDVYICQDIGNPAKPLYTLLVIKSHEVAKQFLETVEKAGEEAENAYIDSFSDKGNLCVVFEYKQDRPLSGFYMGGTYTLSQCEDICTNLVVTCMTSRLPYPLLYLVLTQGQLNLSKDHGIYPGYQLDLTQLDVNITERECAVECAAILRQLLQPHASQKAFSYNLLEKKISRKSYDSFAQLYKDIRIAAVPAKKAGIIGRLKYWFKTNQDRLVHIFMYLCIAFIFFALLSLVTQLIFGDIPWLRLFFNGFKVIGTESLIR